MERRQMSEGLPPESVHSYRERQIDEASKHLANMAAAQNRKKFWKESQKYLALAPVAASSVALATKLESWDGADKAYLFIASAVGSAVLASVAEIRHDRQSEREGHEAIAASVIYHELGLPNPPQVNEAVNRMMGPESLLGKARKTQ